MLIAPTKSVMGSSLLKIIRDGPSRSTISQPLSAAQAGRLLKWDQVNVLNVPSEGPTGGSASLHVTGPDCLGLPRTFWKQGGEAKVNLSCRRWGCAPWPDLFRVRYRLSPVLQTSVELVTPLEIWDTNSTHTPFLDRHILSFVPFLAHRGGLWQLWVG